MKPADQTFSQGTPWAKFRRPHGSGAWQDLRISTDVLGSDTLDTAHIQPGASNVELAERCWELGRKGREDVVVTPKAPQLEPRSSWDGPSQYGVSRDERSLTPRQQQVLKLLAKGRSDKEIASDLGLSAATVRSHLQRLYRQYDLRGRTHAVATLWREAPDNMAHSDVIIKVDELTGLSMDK